MCTDEEKKMFNSIYKTIIEPSERSDEQEYIARQQALGRQQEEFARQQEEFARQQEEFARQQIFAHQQELGQRQIHNTATSPLYFITPAGSGHYY
jgi:hypothetical protein